MALGGLGAGLVGGGLLAGTAHIDIRPDLSTFGPRLKTELSGVIKSVGAFKFDAFDKSLAGIGASTSSLGKILTKNLTVPIVGAGAVAFKFGADFDSVLQRMIGLAGVGANEIDGIRDSLLGLAHETGRGPTELANALYLVRSAGLVGQQALDTVEVSAKASAAGMGDTASVATALTSVLNAYAKTGLTAAQAGDILTAAVRDGAAEADQFAQVIGDVVPLASQLSVGFDQVAASIASLTQVGIDPQTAATNIRQIFASLLAAGKEGTESAKALESVGLSAEQLRADLAKPQGILVVLREISDAFQGNDEALQQVFPNIRALTGAFGLLGQKQEAVDKTFSDTANATGSARKAFDAVRDSAKFKAQQALADLQVTLVQLGETIAPAGSALLGFASGALQSFGRLPGPVSTGTVAILGLAAAIGPLGRLFGGVTTGLAKLSRVVGLQRPLDDLRLGLAGATQSGASFSNRLGFMAQSSTVAGRAIRGVGIAVGGLAASVVAVDLLSGAFETLGKRAPELDRLTLAADAFAKGGIFGGALEETLGAQADRIGEIIDLAQKHQDGLLGKATTIGRGLIDPFSGQGETEINHARSALEGLDQTLSGLVKGGKGQQAKALFDLVADATTRSGHSVGELTALLPDYGKAVGDAGLSSEAGAAGIKKVGAAAKDTRTSLEELVDKNFDLERAQIEAADAVNQFHDAQTALSEARANAAGTGREAIQAARSEQDALRSLQKASQSVTDGQDKLADATQGVVDAQLKLAEARQKLADLDSGPNQRISTLEREQIVRRVVTTPEEARQKEIDLLKFDEDAADKRKSLQEQVADAQRGVEDAVGRVGDAERSLRDDVQSVADAQLKVSEAAKARKQVQVDALLAVEDSEHRVEAAAIAVHDAFKQAEKDKKPLGPWRDALAEIDRTLDPKSPFRKNLDEFLNLINTAGTSTVPFASPDFVGPLTAGESVLKFAAAANPKNGELVTSIASGKGPLTIDMLDAILAGTFQGPLTAAEQEALHQLGVPGFGRGGIADWPMGQARLSVLHGQEQVTRPGQVIGADRPHVTVNAPITVSDRNVAGQVQVELRKQAIRLANTGVRA